MLKVSPCWIWWHLQLHAWKKVCVVSDGLRLVHGGAAPTPASDPPVDPVAFQDSCVEAFRTSQAVRGFAQTSMENNAGVLDRFLTACGRPAWEVTAEDVDRVVAGLVELGLSAATRRGYVQAFKGFHAFLSVRKANEIESVFGVRLVDPIDDFNAARHVDSSSPSAIAPPSDERMEEFFDFLEERIAGARKYAVAGRDYALFRTLYLAGLRAEETASLDRADVHFGRGPFGKVHVRFGKGAKTSGPRPRWVPMLDGLDLILGGTWRRSRPVSAKDRRCFPMRAEDVSAGALSVTGWLTCSSLSRRPAAKTTQARLRWSGLARTRCVMPARPEITNVALTSLLSSRCLGIGTWGRRCGM